ncbi:DUF2550 domain-containing protein [Arthrobacter psychrochitiniphilus]|uniref:DUF2550 domain-containing protein n=2 Tax=Arthrobacter TaxID=1663 RepID=A0A2V3DWM5_9MICC|nr:DUF2550 domain-containing protein [Arthrobacter psychrochitiniphilus]PXA64978.1 DUF2550 domain-containing protein [Arthrobacter psychrochitiniphilus]
MNELGMPFIVLAGLLLLVVLSLCLFGVRRLVLRRTLGTFDTSMCLRSNRWAMGVCRYQESNLQWLRTLSLSPIPVKTLQRNKIVLVGRRDPSEAELTRVPPATVIVVLDYEGAEILLAMKFGAYTGLSSWLEAGPQPGMNTRR